MTVLYQLATNLHKKVLDCNIGDANAETAGHREPFSKMMIYRRKGRKIRILSSTMWMQIDIFGNFQVSPLSVNREDKIWPLRVPAQKLNVAGHEYQVFTRDGTLSRSQARLIADSALLEVIRNAGLGQSESLHTNKGELMAYLCDPSLDRLIAWIDGLVDLAEVIEGPTNSMRIDFRDLPAQFRPLIPLIEKWGIADDLEREETLKASSSRTLKSLVAEVEPYLTAIDSYLDSFRVEPPTEAACALGRLAEGSLEAKLLLAEK